MEWSTAVTDELADLKRCGYDFGRAWTMALAKHRPPLRARGVARPELFEEEESLVDFTQRVCRDAWEGRAPALERFSPGLLAV